MAMSGLVCGDGMVVTIALLFPTYNVGTKVFMGQFHALGVAGGARSVDEGGNVLGSDGRIRRHGSLRR